MTGRSQQLFVAISADVGRLVSSFSMSKSPPFHSGLWMTLITGKGREVAMSRARDASETKRVCPGLKTEDEKYIRH